MKHFLLSHLTKLLLLFFLTGLIFLWFWTDPTPHIKGTIKVFDRNEILIYESSTSIGHQEFVPIERIPQELKDAVVVTEDERFWYHSGVDPLAIVRAIGQNIREGAIVSGASTISQQVVRFSVISPQKPAKVSLIRKVREILMAVRLSYTSSKEEILKRYLNTMYFGRGIYGVGAASRLYFGKSVDNLSLGQSALLAGMIANPTKFDPITNPQGSNQKKNAILDEMFAKKLITEERYERAKEERLPDTIHALEVVAPHAAQMILEEIEKIGISSNEGLSVHTTLDSGWYRLVRDIAKKRVDALTLKHDLTNAAVVIINNSTGAIWTLLGSVDYFAEAIQGQNNMATALRQPGSAIKPVTYAAAFEKGIATAATAIEDKPKVYKTNEGGGFLPHNYDGHYRGIILVREAFASSYNLPAVEMLSRVGLENFLNLSHRMGVTGMQRVGDYDLALTLGGGEITLLELTNLYATFARAGGFLPTHLIERIENSDGELVYEFEKISPNKVLDEKVAWLVTDILKDKKARIPTFGEKNPLVLSQEAAVKTGTTTDWHDNWTIGYTPNFTVGVWVGNADNHPMQEISGVTGAAPIWNQVFEELLKFEDVGGFNEPEGLDHLEICAWDGLLPGDACTQKYIETFISGTEPTAYSPLTEKQTYFKNSQVQILNPLPNSVFEIGAKADEQIVFELSTEEKIVSVLWVIDGQDLMESDCGSILKECHWTPTAGSHTLKAEVGIAGKGKVLLSPINFLVLEYKGGY